MASAALNNASVNHTGNGHGAANIGSVQADTMNFEAQNSQSSGQSFNPNATAANVDFDMKQLISSGVKRIDSANIEANATLRKGEYGEGFTGFEVKNNTNVGANIAVRNNQVQNGSKVQTNKARPTRKTNETR